MECTHALKGAGAQFSIPSGKENNHSWKSFGESTTHNSKSNCFLSLRTFQKAGPKSGGWTKTLMTGIQENKQICLKMKNPEPVNEDGWPDRLLLSRYKKRRNSIWCRSGKGFSGNSVVQGAVQVMGIEAYSVNLESFGFPGRNRNVFGKPDLLYRAGHREAYCHCRTGSRAVKSTPPSPALSASQ